MALGEGAAAVEEEARWWGNTGEIRLGGAVGGGVWVRIGEGEKGGVWIWGYFGAFTCFLKSEMNSVCKFH